MNTLTIVASLLGMLISSAFVCRLVSSLENEGISESFSIDLIFKVGLLIILLLFVGTCIGVLIVNMLPYFENVEFSFEYIRPEN